MQDEARMFADLVKQMDNQKLTLDERLDAAVRYIQGADLLANADTTDRAMTFLALHYNLGSDDAVQRFVENYKEPLGLARWQAAFKEFNALKTTDLVYDRYLGKRPKLDMSDVAIKKRLYGEGLDPYEVPRTVNQSKRFVYDIQSSQIEEIINKMEEAIGSKEKTNYFKVKEAALKAKWTAIIDFLKEKVQLALTQKKKYIQRALLQTNARLTPPAAATISTHDYNILRSRFPFTFPISDKEEPRYYAMYMESNKNLDLSQGVQMWMAIQLSIDDPAIRRDIVQLSMRHSNVVILNGIGNLFSGAEWDQTKITGTIEVNTNIAKEFTIVTKMQTLRSNASNWKFHLKARVGLFDRIYKTIASKMSYADLDGTLNKLQIAEKLQVSWEAYKSRKISIKAAEMLFYGVTDEVHKEFGNNVTASAYALSSEGWMQVIQANNNLNRAFFAQRQSLSDNAKKRMNRYLNKDKKDLNRIKYFLGNSN